MKLFVDLYIRHTTCTFKVNNELYNTLSSRSIEKRFKIATLFLRNKFVFFRILYLFYNTNYSQSFEMFDDIFENSFDCL